MIFDLAENKNKTEALERKHYRMNCLWDISFRKAEADQGETTEHAWFTAITTDVSGGGCRFNSSEYSKPDSMLIVKFAEPHKKKEELIFKGKVIASLPLPNRKEIYETRIKFVELSFVEQEQLIKWIFEEKRKLKWEERSLLYEEKYFNY